MQGKELDEEVLMDLRKPGKNLSSQPKCSMLSDGATYGGENKANVTNALVYKYVIPKKFPTQYIGRTKDVGL